jgi:signal transduction histidine kinase
MMQISVQDTGIGIKKEDQSKLFKLFGFLERTKEINSMGIGLGLHICKMIVQQLGGDIDCESIWLEGSTFTFLIALNEMKEQDITVQRYRNPLRKNYPKLKIHMKEDDLVCDKAKL